MRRLAQDPATVPQPRDMLRARLLLAVAAVLLVGAVTGALRGIAAMPLALILAAQLLPRASVLTSARG